eukprot:2588473-Alexandrium_andersonii.AAC.1
MVSATAGPEAPPQGAPDAGQPLGPSPVCQLPGLASDSADAWSVDFCGSLQVPGMLHILSNATRDLCLLYTSPSPRD